ncbi:hypothetical protein CDD81_7625 [Ophiocordyceps australis]|uniref:asparagine--tRNA ligase n=1 Tax=Ophiocordyceps australis TaxID=1399860 RepID=A0A2C5X8Y9_9HYPO|nr:hypothetical protein CDD81_7625 [Ophiocordyceps australis]
MQRSPLTASWRRLPGPSLPCRRYSVRFGCQAQPWSSMQTVADLAASNLEADVANVDVCGWVRSVRKSANVRFVDISDGSSMRPIQAVVDKSLAAELRPGAAVRLSGTWCNLHRQSDGAETGKTTTSHELRVQGVDVLGPSNPQTYPIQNKYQTPESLRTIVHMRWRTPVNSTLLRLRSDAIALVTRFFFDRKFQQTHPPIITSSDCEGAGEAFSLRAGTADDFFRQPKYLTVSSQLHLEAQAQALGNVWCLSPTFRAEKSDTCRHLSEFYMLEAEMSFVDDMEHIMDLVQQLMADLARGLESLNAATELRQNRLDSRNPAETLAFADLVDAQELRRRWRGLAHPSRWPRITYTEAIERLQSVASNFEHPPVWGEALQSEHEKWLAEQVGRDEAGDSLLPVFITHFPRIIKAFYMLRSSSHMAAGETADCFDLIVPGLGELAGGSMREHRLSELQDNMRLHGLRVPASSDNEENPLAWYLDLRRWGCPPHGGFGLGFDRLLSYLSGVPNVRDVVPFPRHHGRCDC